MENISPNNTTHIELIQNVITRMNSNSFQIKGLAVALTTGLLAVYGANPKVIFIFIGLLPNILFWLLDTYYLQMERKFRGLYDDIICSDNTIPPFSMNIIKYKGKKYSFFNVLCSKSILPLYLSIIAFLLLLSVGIQYNSCV
jgi:hypothetical protein